MQDIFYIETIEQALTLLKPIRIDILKQMEAPRTCPELAKILGDTTQKIYYHVKALEEVGLIDKVEEQRVRGIMEGHYQAKARSYWLASQLIGDIGGEQPAQDQTSLRYLMSLAEEIHHDVGHLGQIVGQPIPSMGLNATIHLPDSTRRAEFLHEVNDFFRYLAEKYGTSEDERSDAKPSRTFKLILTCYPAEVSTDDND